MFNLSRKKKVLILGGGFGGLYTAVILNFLAKNPFLNINLDITLIDRKTDFIFYPFLYETLSGELSEDDVTIRYDEIKELKEIKIVKGEVESANIFERFVETVDKERYDYDILISALGSKVRLPKLLKGKPNVFLFKSLLDVEKIKHQISYQFKRYKSKIDKSNGENPEELTKELQPLLTFLVVGAGPSGVELSSKLKDIINAKCEENEINPDFAKVILIDINDKVLANMHKKTTETAQKVLKKKGVEIYLGTSIHKLEDDIVTLLGKERFTIPCANVIWTGGTEANPVLKNFGIDTSMEGRILVDAHLQSVHSMGVFALGDNAVVEKNKVQLPLPQTGKVAVQQSIVCAYNIIAHLKMFPMIEYQYIDVGEMIAIGTDSAYVDILGNHFDGKTAKWVRKLIYSFIYPGIDSIMKMSSKMMNKANKDGFKLLPF